MTDRVAVAEVSSARSAKAVTVEAAEIGNPVRSVMEIAPQAPAVKTIPDLVQVQEAVLQPRAILKALRATVEALLA